MRHYLRLFLLGVTFLLSPNVESGQSLDKALSRKVDFIPNRADVQDQLIEVAQYYKIPMGIEWFWLTNEQRENLSIPPQPTVAALIRAIVERAPGYRMEISNGMVLISHSSFSKSHLNFLNLRLSEVKFDKVNVFGAQWSLRFNIHRTLHPDVYAYGSNGGYGYGHNRDDKLDVANISFVGQDVKVREALNAIVKANGNSLWVVEFVPSKMMKREPFYAQRAFGADVDEDFAWRIIPFTSTP